LPKIVFDSAQLPGNNRLRKEAWIDTLASNFGHLNVDPAPDVHFEGALEIVPLDNGSVSSIAGTFRTVTRAAEAVGADGLDAIVLVLNTCQETLRISQRGRDIDCVPGVAILYDLAQPSLVSVATTTMSRVLAIQVPRRLMRARLADFEDRILAPAPSQSVPLSLARAYAEALLSQSAPAEPALSQLVIGHFADLVAAGFESAAEKNSHGQGALHLIAIGLDIDRGFDNPDFSLATLARRLGVTPRHVQRLLAANQTSFVDEVMLRRLNRARAMLTSSRHAHINIIDIAHECGFSTVSHFHRVFRQRYGMTPGDMREAAKRSNI
jgi:AraC-like DNA-binding protein